MEDTTMQDTPAQSEVIKIESSDSADELPLKSSHADENQVVAYRYFGSQETTMIEPTMRMRTLMTPDRQSLRYGTLGVYSTDDAWNFLIRYFDKEFSSILPEYLPPKLLSPDKVFRHNRCDDGFSSVSIFRRFPGVSLCIADARNKAIDLCENSSTPSTYSRTSRTKEVVTIREGLRDRLPCAADSFDVSITNLGRYLADFGSPRTLVNETFRTLKTGGVAVFSVPTELGIRRAIDRIQEQLPKSEEGGPSQVLLDTTQWCSFDKLQEMMKDVGFRDTAVWTRKKRVVLTKEELKQVVLLGVQLFTCRDWFAMDYGQWLPDTVANLIDNGEFGHVSDQYGRISLKIAIVKGTK